MPVTVTGWPACSAPREIFSRSHAPSVSISRTPARSTRRRFALSSCGATALNRLSSTLALITVHDPVGRSSSVSPTVATLRSGAELIAAVREGYGPFYLGGRSTAELDLPQCRLRHPVLRHIKAACRGAHRIFIHSLREITPCRHPRNSATNSLP